MADLVDEHEDDGGVSPAGFGEEGEGVGVVEKLVAKRPVHGGCRREGEGEHIQCSKQVYVLELLWFPHRMHDFTEYNFILSITFLFNQQCNSKTAKLFH